MKKKIALLVLFWVCALACAFGLAGCNPDSSEPPPQKLIAPTDIVVSVGADWLGVKSAYYGNGNIGDGTEIKLDDGEWTELGNKADVWHDNARLLYENLEVASTHVIYARAKEYRDYLPSDEFSKQVTLNKGTRTDKPEGLSLKMIDGMVGKIEGFTDEMEVVIGYGAVVETSDNDTIIFDRLGYQSVRVRYKETDKYFASEPASIDGYATVFSGGSGTEEEPLLVKTFEQFIAMGTQERTKLPNDGNPYFRLVNDITYPEETQAPIPYNLYFINLDGNGKKIIGAKVAATQKDWYAGIFEKLNSVKNLTVENAEVTVTYNDYRWAGTYTGLLAGSIQDAYGCKASGTIKLEISDGDDVGGFSELANLPVGGLSGSCAAFENCVADVKVILPTAPKRGLAYELKLGGLAGNGGNSVTLKQSSAKISVSGVAAAARIGGLIGQCSEASIENSCAEIAVDLSLCEFPSSTGGVNPYHGHKEASYIGGLTGHIEKSFSAKNSYAFMNCTVNGAKDGFQVNVGGLASSEFYTPDKDIPITAENCFIDFSVDFDGAGTEPVIMGGSLNNRFGTFTSASEALTLIDCYYLNSLPAVAAEGATATAESDLRDIDWQKAHLNWDEEIWKFNNYLVDGYYYPTLK